MERKICPNCGHLCDEDTYYCPVCHTLLNFESSNSPVALPIQPKKTYKATIISSIVSLLAIYAMYSNINDQPPEDIGNGMLMGFTFLAFITFLVYLIFDNSKNKEAMRLYDIQVQQNKNSIKYRNMLEAQRLENNKKLEELLVKINTLKSQHIKETTELKEQNKTLKEQLQTAKDDVIIENFDVHKLTFLCERSLEYRSKLEFIRTSQKEMIKLKSAILSGDDKFAINGILKTGSKMLKDIKAVLLKSFNQECDAIISNIKATNFDVNLSKITKAKNNVSTLGEVFGIYISDEYYHLKLMEARLSYEYNLKTQEEKEEQRAIREELKEQTRIQREIDEERKKLEKEQMHYANALEDINQKLTITSDGTQKTVLERRKAEIECEIIETQKAIEDVDYRQANQRAGYVYIISNIGAFGENVYKIGMTRRLDPQDRIDELGGASVPFRFDVHAVIFSDDAPTLENALHRAFENQRMNWVNNRKEFFKVKLEDIKKVVYQNFDKTVAFIDIPEAEQFRVSERIKLEKLGSSACSNIQIPTVSITPEVPQQLTYSNPSPTQQISPVTSNNNEYPQYSTLISIIKNHFGTEASLEYIEKPNAFNIIVSKNDLKSVRVRAYQRENNPFDITLYRPDGTTLRIIFFNNQSELKDVLKNSDETLLQSMH